MSGLSTAVLVADEESKLAGSELTTSLDLASTARSAAERRRRAGRRLLIASDAVVLLLAALVAGAVAGGPKVTDLGVSALVGAIALLMAAGMGLHRRDAGRINRETLDEVPRLVQVAILFALGGYVALQVADPTALNARRGALIAIGLLVAVTLLLVGGRLLARRLARRVVRPERCLVLGSPEMSARIDRKLATNSRLHALVTAVVDDGALSETLADLAERLDGGAVDRVILAGPTGIIQAEAARLAVRYGVGVSVLAAGYETFGQCAEIDSVDGITLLGVPPFGLTPAARRVKRVFDLVVAGLALVASAPLFAAIAAAMKVTSPGPLFFRQQRVGYAGRVFPIVKFRTMATDAEARKAELADQNQAAGLFKIADDPRVTPLGRILRKYSLDELPQLWNVISGQMSIVGPRPLVVDEDAAFTGWERRRYAVAPGMTGPWQILGSTRVPVQDMVVLDYLYSVNWSLWRDLKICLRTVAYLLSRESGEHHAAKR